jgi:hypothetical protein
LLEAHLFMNSNTACLGTGLTGTGLGFGVLIVDLLFFLFLLGLERPAPLDTFLATLLPLDQHGGDAVEKHGDWPSLQRR